MPVITNKEQIDEILSRSVAEVLPSKEALAQRLASGKRIRLYVGADATGPELHLGHSTNFLLLEKLRQLGHEVIILFGDFTARIGDPTDKGAARQRLTKEEVEENIAGWKEQVAPILSLTDPENPAVIKQNSEWLAPLGFGDVVDIASHFTVQHMLERDMFEKRIKGGKPVYLHEFLYPLMQGYDSVAMDVDGEVGGTDQTFNMLAGRTLQKAYNEKEKFVISTTLLAHPESGKKLMSKSEGGYIALNDIPHDMFGKVMALPDQVMTQMFIDCTLVPMEEVNDIRAQLESGDVNPRDIKMRLAREIVRMYHGEEQADQAEASFVGAFQQGGVPIEIPTIVVEPETPLADALLEHGLVESKSAFRRLVESGAVKNTDTGEKIEDPAVTVSEGAVLKIGKKIFVRLELQ